MSKPLKRILAATDLSRHAEVALRRAAVLAHAHGAELELVHALAGTPVLVPAWGDPGAAPWLREEVLAEGVREHLEQLAKQLGERYRVDTHIRTVGGPPQQAIPTQAEAWDADLVVIGAHGEGGLLDRLLGSTARKLLRRCRRPVLVVRRDTDSPYTCLLAATDFSPHAERAARMAARLAPTAGLILAHTHEPEMEKRLAYAKVDKAMGRRYLEAAARHAAEQLERAVAGLAEGGIKARGVLREGHPARLLTALIEENGVELVAVGAHGKSAIEAGLLGSTSEHLVGHAPCDVLVVPGAEG